MTKPDFTNVTTADLRKRLDRLERNTSATTMQAEMQKWFVMQEIADELSRRAA